MKIQELNRRVLFPKECEIRVVKRPWLHSFVSLMLTDQSLLVDYVFKLANGERSIVLIMLSRIFQEYCLTFTIISKVAHFRYMNQNKYWATLCTLITSILFRPNKHAKKSMQANAEAYRYKLARLLSEY